MNKLRPVVLLQSALVGAMLVAAACGGSSGKSIKGTVTKVDTNAKTFSVQATDGKGYDFRMVSGSKGDITEIKDHLDKKRQIEVKYKGSSAPYDVDNAD